jgi:hypothetical protein
MIRTLLALSRTAASVHASTEEAACSVLLDPNVRRWASSEEVNLCKAYSRLP